MTNPNPVKKVIAVHDLSGYGRCSLSVILPVLAAMGVQPISLPTALLSTHTGGYTDFTFLDLTSQIEPIYQHWLTLNSDFHAIYSGFLAHAAQVQLVENLIEAYQNKTKIILVDPVMGDDGVLYATCDEPLLQEMKRLIGKATIITPNITEAVFLLGKPYKEYFNPSEVKNMLYALAEMGPKQVVITGFKNKNNIHTGYLDTATGEVNILTQEKVNKGYPGTGDVFASILLGHLLKPDPLDQSVHSAADFVRYAIQYSAQYDYPEREGILLEPLLYKLTDRMKDVCTTKN
ncbi:MAG TPA: pyridoxamine kinase [Clostridiales bacterium]|jgi:pyridoxine kinase|nr:pyridoxamine kinase [Clostridiales bacterium]HBE14565.1 pyridoxamine kinase [Clostridiales bacterium]